VLGGEPAPRPDVTPGTIAPLAIDPDAAEAKAVTFAIPDFAGETEPERAIAKTISQTILKDLSSTGLFAAVGAEAYEGLPAGIAIKPVWSDWANVGVQALIVGKVILPPQGGVSVQFRVHDISGGQQLIGTQYAVSAADAQSARLAHKIADDIYQQITNDGAYFDSRIAYVTDEGNKSALNIADYDGSMPERAINNAITMQAPRFSPRERLFVYSADAPVPGKPSQAQRTTIVYDLATGRRDPLSTAQPQANADARFSPDGRSMIYSRKIGGNNEIVLLERSTRKEKLLTQAPSSDISPSLSPDGQQFVFVSDRETRFQLYVARVDGADVACASGPTKACRISSDGEAYAKPAWSPTGEFIAFERREGAGASIGVVRPNGEDERILTKGSKDASPAWSPNGRVLVFARSSGDRSKLWTIERAGRYLRELPTQGDALEPDWGPQLD
jgi:TolB protein